MSPPSAIGIAALSPPDGFIALPARRCFATPIVGMSRRTPTSHATPNSAGCKRPWPSTIRTSGILEKLRTTGSIPENSRRARYVGMYGNETALVAVATSTTASVIASTQTAAAYMRSVSYDTSTPAIRSAAPPASSSVTRDARCRCSRRSRSRSGTADRIVTNRFAGTWPDRTGTRSLASSWLASGSTGRPSARTTRWAAGIAGCSVNQEATARAARTSPRARAMAPHVATRPRGIWRRHRSRASGNSSTPAYRCAPAKPFYTTLHRRGCLVTHAPRRTHRHPGRPAADHDGRRPRGTRSDRGGGRRRRNRGRGDRLLGLRGPARLRQPSSTRREHASPWHRGRRPTRGDDLQGLGDRRETHAARCAGRRTPGMRRDDPVRDDELPRPLLLGGRGRARREGVRHARLPVVGDPRRGRDDAARESCEERGTVRREAQGRSAR